MNSDNNCQPSDDSDDDLMYPPGYRPSDPSDQNFPVEPVAAAPSPDCYGVRNFKYTLPEAKLRILSCCRDLGISTTREVKYPQVQKVYELKFGIPLDQKEMYELFADKKPTKALKSGVEDFMDIIEASQSPERVIKLRLKEGSENYIGDMEEEYDGEEMPKLTPDEIEEIFNSAAAEGSSSHQAFHGIGHRIIYPRQRNEVRQQTINQGQQPQRCYDQHVQENSTKFVPPLRTRAMDAPEQPSLFRRALNQQQQRQQSDEQQFHGFKREQSAVTNDQNIDLDAPSKSKAFYCTPKETNDQYLQRCQQNGVQDVIREQSSAEKNSNIDQKEPFADINVQSRLQRDDTAVSYNDQPNSKPAAGPVTKDRKHMTNAEKLDNVLKKVYDRLAVAKQRIQDAVNRDIQDAIEQHETKMNALIQDYKRICTPKTKAKLNAQFAELKKKLDDSKDELIKGYNENMDEGFKQLNVTVDTYRHKFEKLYPVQNK